MATNRYTEDTLELLEAVRPLHRVCNCGYCDAILTAVRDAGRYAKAPEDVRDLMPPPAAGIVDGKPICAECRNGAGEHSPYPPPFTGSGKFLAG